MRLADATTLDTSARTGAKPLVLIPVGSTEQHGPHLPLATDSVIAESVANLVGTQLAHAGRAVVVGPVLAYGASGEHQHFAGTASVGTQALRMIVVELTRSLATWAAPVVFVNGHGGNIEALTRAVSQLTEEGHDVRWYSAIRGYADAHAGLTETSLMLHLRPELVRVELAEPGNCAPLAELLPAMRAGGVQAVAPNGILGDPTGANAELGRELLTRAVDELVEELR